MMEVLKGGNAPRHLVITATQYCTGDLGNARITGTLSKRAETKPLPPRPLYYNGRSPEDAHCPEGYCSVTDAAKKLDISVSWIRNHCKNEGLPAIRTGRSVWVNCDQITEYRMKGGYE